MAPPERMADLTVDIRDSFVLPEATTESEFCSQSVALCEHTLSVVTEVLRQKRQSKTTECLGGQKTKNCCEH